MQGFYTPPYSNQATTPNERTPKLSFRIPIYNALYGDDQGPKLMVLKIICLLFTWTLYLVDVVMYSLFFVIFLGLRHKTKTAWRNLAV